MVVNLATIVLIFFLTRDLFDSLAGGIAAAAYSLLAVSPSVFGTAAHATHFVAFFGVAGTWALVAGLAGGQKAVAFPERPLVWHSTANEAARRVLVRIRRPDGANPLRPPASLCLAKIIERVGGFFGRRGPALCRNLPMVMVGGGV